MAFRAYESEVENRDRAIRFLTRSLPEGVREKSKSKLEEIIDKWGPVVDGYPSWHPLVWNQGDRSCPKTAPQDGCGYKGLDHTVLLQNAFITCPYSDGKEVIESVEALPSHLTRNLWRLEAQLLKFKLYHPTAAPVLVECHWLENLEVDRTIPLRVAAGLLLETELPSWKTAQRAETWETMRPFFLGSPCGSRSSLFVNEATGQGLKKLWKTVIETGIYGPIIHRDQVRR